MKIKRLLSVLLVVVMALGVLAGCNNTSRTTGNYKPVLPEGENGKITKDPLELTLHMRIWNDAFSYDKSTMFQEAFKDTNIKLRGTSSEAASDANQEFNIMLASDPLPDLIHGSKVNLNGAAMDGALVPLDDLIDQYAPNIKAFLDATPELKKGSVASDGKLYYVPYYREGKPSVGFYIRTDWLKKLNLDIPKTVDEYYNALKAFREQDPNGNGQKDEVPYFYRDKGVDGLLQLWNARAGWYVDDNGKYLNGKMQPEYKTAMINLAKWYQEGLIDKEIYSRGQQARNILLGDNVGGSTHDWFSSTGAFNDSLKDKVPGLEFTVIPPPADVNGKVKEEFGRTPVPGTGWAISVDNKYVVETIKYMDFWYSEKGLRIYNYGVEGVDYNMVDGKPVFTDVVLKAESGAPTYLRYAGQNEIGSRSFIDGELQAMNKYAREGFMMYDNNNYVLDQLPSLSLTEEEERIVTEKAQAITTYMSEVQQKWLFGNESVEAGWDAYLQQVKALGFDELQAAYQAAYDRYQSVK